MSFPVVNASISSQTDLLSNQQIQGLLIGQKTSLGSAISGKLYTNIQNNSDFESLFGSHSIVADMIRNFKAYNKTTRVDVIPLDDNGSAVAATGSLVFSGTATQDGTYVINIGSNYNYSFTISVSNGDTATDIGDSVEIAINNNNDIPVSALNAAGTVTLTALNGGTVLNNLGLQIIGSITGLSTLVNKMSGGANDPSTTGIFDVVGNTRYQRVVMPYEYGVNVLTAFLDPRFNTVNAVEDGVGVVSVTNTFATLNAIGDNENSASLVIHGNILVNETNYKGSALFELDYNVSSQFAAISLLRLTSGADISEFVVSPASNDQVGGINISSLPYFNTPFYNLNVIDPQYVLMDNEVSELNDSGIFVLTNNVANNTVVSSQVVTTYKTDAAGNNDDTFKFLNSVDTSVAIRQEYFFYSKARYAQTRLTTGDVQPNTGMVNTGTITADFTGLYDTLSESQYTLTVAGEDALNYYKDNLNVTITNYALGQVNASGIYPIVSQMRQLTIPISINLQIG